MVSILHCTTCTGLFPFFCSVLQNLGFAKVGSSQYILRVHKANTVPMDDAPVVTTVNELMEILTK